MGKGFRCFSSALIGVALILAGTSTAWAHTDPAGATATGVGFNLTAFRADGTTPVFPGRINQCETIIYRATLSYNTNTSSGINAAFEGGTLTITKPDASTCVTTSIPCIGGDGSSPIECPAAIQSFTTADCSFTAAVADCTATPLLSASAAYSGGTAHIDPNPGNGIDENLVGVVSAGTGFAAGTNCCVDDGNVCNGIVVCDPAAVGQFCGTSPTTGTACDASNTNGDGVTHTGTCVAGTPVVCNDDGNACNGPEVCDTTDGSCDSGPAVICNDDGNACNGPEVCDTTDGSCDSGPAVICNDDGDSCNGPEVCDTTDGSCDSGPPPPPCVDPVCTICDPTSPDGTCIARDPLPLECTPSDVTCRTPGFWGTHGGIEKGGPNITQAVLNETGPLTICGEIVSTTDLTDTSAIEAICVSPKGDSVLQLARQLTAAALNCGVTKSTTCGGGGQTAGDVCGGVTSIEDVFDACNTACAAGNVTASLDGGVTTFNCIDAIDCFNNGGTGLVDGICDGDSGCHDRNGSGCIDLTSPGPASSPRKCNDARKDDETIF